MQQYLLFTYNKFYPKGGWRDFRESFLTLAEAIVAVANKSDDNAEYWHVVDMDTQTIVAHGNRLGEPNGGGQA